MAAVKENHRKNKGIGLSALAAKYYLPIVLEFLGLLPGALHLTDRIPLALLPGLLTDRALWAHQIEALADLAESWVADFSTQGSIAEMARSVLTMMPARFALAGLSMGGFVAMEVMRQAPQRVGLLTVIEDCGHLTPMERPEEVTAALRAWLEDW